MVPGSVKLTKYPEGAKVKAANPYPTLGGYLTYFPPSHLKTIILPVHPDRLLSLPPGKPCTPPSLLLATKSSPDHAPLLTVTPGLEIRLSD